MFFSQLSIFQTSERLYPATLFACASLDKSEIESNQHKVQIEKMWERLEWYIHGENNQRKQLDMRMPVFMVNQFNGEKPNGTSLCLSLQQHGMVWIHVIMLFKLFIEIIRQLQNPVNVQKSSCGV